MKNLTIRFGLLISLMTSIILISCKDDELAQISPVAYKYEFSVYENAANNDFIGIIRAFNNRPNNKITFSITGGDEGNVFAVDSVTGTITVSNASMLDYEKVNVYNLKVLVKDSFGNIDSTNINIDVKNSGIPYNGMVCCQLFANSLKDYLSGKTLTGQNISYFFDRSSWPVEAVQFMGYKSYVILDSIYDFPSRTISFWFKAMHMDGAQILYCSDNESINNGSTYFVISDTKKLYWSAGNAIDSIFISENQWYHTAITVKPGEANFYLNGELISSKPITELDYSSWGYNKAILGAYITLEDFYYQGLIDDLFIYNRALSSPEIKLIYTEPDFAW